MSIFDSPNNQGGSNGGRTVSVVFTGVPETISAFTSLSQAVMQTPFDTVALCVVALCVYPINKDESIAMMNYLKGPAPLSTYDISFIAERMVQNGKAPYLALSYFNGATPQNDYKPSSPYTVVVSENPYSYQEEGYANLFVSSGGADNPRPVKLRKAKDGKWYLWEFGGLLSDIRAPESSNPWA